MDAGHSLEEKVAATAVASLSGNGYKRPTEDSAADEGGRSAKLQKLNPPTFTRPMEIAGMASAAAPEREQKKDLLPAPFFFYKDHSQEPDDDPLTPLTPPGRVPNFPAKMHAILSRPDLADVVAWMPHGRSWRVLKPREFEIRVIPTYFEHSKFSSFIRQANGWGFRRITQGPDRNSYYHELFLRGLPHLCKKMKRPGVAEKAAADSEHEPDFYKISRQYPVPEKQGNEDDSIMLRCTLVGGPKARMPVYTGPPGLTLPQVPRAPQSEIKDVKPAGPSPMTPRDKSVLEAFHRALSVSGNHVRMNKPQEQGLPGAAAAKSNMFPPKPFTTVPPASQQVGPAQSLSKVDSLAAANQLAFAIQPQSFGQAAAAQAAANAQFAAGFMAGSTLSQNQIRSLLGQAFASSNQFGRLPQAQAASPYGSVVSQQPNKR